MKMCPRCNKQYDDTWKVCFNCSVPLVDAAPAGQGAEDLRRVRSEIQEVKDLLAGLAERIDSIEYAFSGQESSALIKEPAAAKKEGAQEPAAASAPQKTIGAPVKRLMAFKYYWKLNGLEMLGEYHCKDKDALLNHVRSLSGELIRIIEEKAIEVEKKWEPAPRRSVRADAQASWSNFRDNVREKAAQPKKSIAENFEQMLGGQWFNKLGILAVVIGVALLIGYSFQYLGPVGKIGIGFAFGVGMLVFGHFIEKKTGFLVYGRGLIGGGWAITYFTAFALHHIPAVRLIESPLAGMALLLAVAAVTIVDIYRYRSQAATAFSYLLIFITLMISPVSVFTMLAAVPVALSLVFFMYRMRWLAFGLYGMAMTYLTYMGWFKLAQIETKAPMTAEEFVVASAFLVLYWAIFVIATLLIKDDEKPAGASSDMNFGMKEVTHTVNTLAASFLGWTLISSGFDRYGLAALALASGLYLALAIIIYQMRKRSLYIISSTFSILFAAVYLAVKYTGYPLTVAYIVLAQLVLLAGILLKESYWRMFAFALLGVVIGKLLIVDSFIVQNKPLAAHLGTRTLLFGFAFLVYLMDHYFYAKLKAKGLLAEAEERHAAIISYSYPLIYAMGTWLDLPKVLTAPCWIILGVILLQLGVAKNNYHQRVQGYILCIGAFTRLLMSNMLVQGGISIVSYRVLTCVPVLLLLYYCVMLLQDEKVRGMLKGSERRMIFIYPYMIFIVIMLLVWYEAPKQFVAPTWGMIAVAYSLRGVYSREKHYLSISSIAAIAACARAVFVNLLQAKYLVGADGNIAFPVVTIGVLYLGNIFYLKSKEALKEIEGTGEKKITIFLRSSRMIYSLSATVLLTVLLAVKCQGALLTVSFGIEGLLLFLFGFALKEKHWRIYGLVILLVTLAKAFLVDLRQLSTLYYILSLIGLGITLLFVSYIYTKHKDKIRKLI